MGFKVTDLTTPFFHIQGLESQTECFVHKSTLFVLTFLSILLSAKPFFGSAIACQVPKDWPTSSTSYFHEICYYGHRKAGMYRKTAERSYGRGLAHTNVITGTSDYYMWIPYILIMQTMVTLLPALLWKFVGLSCFNGNDVLALLEAYVCQEEQNRVSQGGWRSRKFAVQFHNWSSEKSKVLYGKSRTLLVYVVMKWFRFFLFVAQFYMIAHLFEGGNLLWGVQEIRDFWFGQFQNPLRGEFTLMAGCKVERLQMTTSSKVFATRVNTVETSCILASNFLYAKVFLFLYWWFLAAILFCLSTSVRFTAILLIPKYRRYCFQSLIPNQVHFVERFGEPHPDLDLGLKEPIDYLCDHVGSDGFLLTSFVFDVFHYHGIQHLTGEMWKLVVVQNGEVLEDDSGEQKEKENMPRIESVEEDGGGDRYYGGKDEKRKKSVISSIEEEKEPLEPLEKTSSVSSLSTSSTVEADDRALLPPKI